MSSSYYILGLLMACSALLSSWMFIASKAHVSAKVILTVVLVAISLGTWKELNNIMGYPVNDYPKDGSLVISHIIIDKTAYVWVFEEDQPRAYKFIVTDEELKKLREAEGLGGGMMIFYRGIHGSELHIIPSMPQKKGGLN